MGSILKNTEKGDWGRCNYIFNQATPEVVILGSSRAIHHYDPRIFSDTLGLSCYNCGEDGMGILLMYARFQSIISRQKPKIVIYEVLPDFDFFKETDNSKYLRFLRPYTDIPHINKIVNAISSTERYKLLSEGYCYNSVFLDILSQRISKYPETAKDYTYTPLTKNINQEPIVIESELKPVIDNTKTEYFRKLIKICRNENVKLFFTASPSYRAKNDSDYALLKNYCDMYCVPFVNHHSDTLYSTNATLFSDVAHLNIRGAEMLSSMVVSEIKAVLEK